MTLHITLEQDAWFSALVEVGSHAFGSGNSVQVFPQVIARFDDDRMVEIYSGGDSLMLFEQPGTFA
ncbi:hypothetical protein [Tateyamaria pelophila]|uniref:hypothetical protein n=1 Tax=Tateyamaria pelophila TaxID=328415 RepID=UPI001CBFD026|nr:hypothetical protein [Tateyamaria pelophila]